MGWGGISIQKASQSRQVKWKIQELEDYRSVRHRCPRSSEKRGICDKAKRFENAHRIFKIYCYCFENVLAVLYSLAWNIYMNQVFAKELTLGRFFLDLFLNGVSFSVISLVSLLLLDNRI